MSIYTVHKKSGTYSELLETYGLANLLHKIFDAVNLPDTKIVITDKEYCFEVSTDVDITDEILSKLKYFPPFKYIKHILPTASGCHLCRHTGPGGGNRARTNLWGLSGAPDPQIFKAPHRHILS